MRLRWGLMVIAMLGAVALRLLPFYTPVASDWAKQSIHRQVAAQIAARAGTGQAAMTPAALDAAVDHWIADHAVTLAPTRRALERGYRDAITFTGEDGRRHVYLGADDGYYWLRLARADLAHGTVCGRVEDGRCIDTQANAPVGLPIEYVASPHVLAIAALHRVLSRFDPGIPLSTSAMILPLLLSAALVVPAFLLVQRLANPFGGLVAALALSWNMYVIGRTVDSDDDIWIVCLPVAVTWLLAASLDRPRGIGRVALAFLSGTLLGVLAATWNGWPLYGLLTAAGLAAILGWHWIVALLARIRAETPPEPLFSRLGLCAVCLLAGFSLVAWAFGVKIDVTWILHQLAGQIVTSGDAPPTADTAPWPYVFSLVAELAPVTAPALVAVVGLMTLGLGLAGFVLPLAGGRSNGPAKGAALSAGGVTIALALDAFDGGQAGTLGGLTLLALLAAASGLRRGDRPPASQATPALLGLAWLGATLAMTFHGTRFIVLAMVPLSLSAGVAAGRLAAGLSEGLAGRFRAARIAGMAGSAGLAIAILAPVGLHGYREAYGHYPRVDHAWADTFSDIRDRTDPDAILDLWWDYGHWATYLAERRVSLDGASLRSRNVHWIARALAASSDGESLALLRMLNCGTVTDPDDGTRERPYETLLKWQGDGARAYRTLSRLLRAPREAAEDALASEGLAPGRRAVLIETMYCTPPESYLVLSTELLNISGWVVAGLWEPWRARLFDLAQQLPPDRAVASIESELDLPESLARLLRDEAAMSKGDPPRTAFAAPQAHLWAKAWAPCVDVSGFLRCPLTLGPGVVAAGLEEVFFDPADPAGTRVRLHNAGSGMSAEAIPAVVQVALPDRLMTVKPPGSTTAELGVLVDPIGRRAFVGTPKVLDSTVVRLVLLDGRYSPRFQKAGDRTTIDGERVTAWRIVWKP